MSAAVQTVTVSGDLLQEATRHLLQMGISTQDWIQTAPEERLELDELDATAWRERSSRATGRRLTEILQGVSDNPPDAGDEMPAGHVDSALR